jgi:hypothetical protein
MNLGQKKASLTDAQRQALERWRRDEPSCRLRADGVLEVRFSNGRGRFGYEVDRDGQHVLVEAKPPSRRVVRGKRIQDVGGISVLGGFVWALVGGGIAAYAVCAAGFVVGWIGHHLSGWDEGFVPASHEAGIFDPIQVGCWFRDRRPIDD